MSVETKRIFFPVSCFEGKRQDTIQYSQSEEEPHRIEKTADKSSEDPFPEKVHLKERQTETDERRRDTWRETSLFPPPLNCVKSSRVTFDDKRRRQQQQNTTWHKNPGKYHSSEFTQYSRVTRKTMQEKKRKEHRTQSSMKSEVCGEPCFPSRVVLWRLKRYSWLTCCLKDGACFSICANSIKFWSSAFLCSLLCSLASGNRTRFQSCDQYSHDDVKSIKHEAWPSSRFSCHFF